MTVTPEQVARVKERRAQRDAADLELAARIAGVDLHAAPASSEAARARAAAGVVPSAAMLLPGVVQTYRRWLDLPVPRRPG